VAGLCQACAYRKLLAIGKLTIGAWKLEPLALPFEQDDFCVEYA
jgi:hypothetical protein